MVERNGEEVQLACDRDAHANEGHPGQEMAELVVAVEGGGEQLRKHLAEQHGLRPESTRQRAQRERVNLHPLLVLHLQARDHLILPVRGLSVIGLDGQLVSADGVHQRHFDGRDFAVQEQSHRAEYGDDDGVDEEPCAADERHQVAVRVCARLVVAEHHGQHAAHDDQAGPHQLATTHRLVQPEMGENNVGHQGHGGELQSQRAEQSRAEQSKHECER